VLAWALEHAMAQRWARVIALVSARGGAQMCAQVHALQCASAVSHTPLAV
jgi:Flp pilus assembly CpaE family ATPase